MSVQGNMYRAVIDYDHGAVNSIRAVATDPWEDEVLCDVVIHLGHDCDHIGYFRFKLWYLTPVSEGDIQRDSVAGMTLSL